MKASFFTSVILFTVSSLGAPMNTTSSALAHPTSTPTYTSGTIISTLPSQVTNKPISTFATVTSGGPVQATNSPASGPTTTLFPSLRSQWKSGDPDAKGLNTNEGHLLTTPWSKVNTAVYFNLDSSVEGKKCKLVFRLNNEDSIVNQNAPTNAGATFDIYRLDGCLNQGYSWNHPLARGILAGVLTPTKGGAADWKKVNMSADKTEPVMGDAPEWECAAGEYSFEMVAADYINIGWNSARGSGLSLEIS